MEAAGHLRPEKRAVTGSTPNGDREKMASAMGLLRWPPKMTELDLVVGNADLSVRLLSSARSSQAELPTTSASSIADIEFGSRHRRD